MAIKKPTPELELLIKIDDLISADDCSSEEQIQEIKVLLADFF